MSQWQIVYAPYAPSSIALLCSRRPSVDRGSSSSYRYIHDSGQKTFLPGSRAGLSLRSRRHSRARHGTDHASKPLRAFVYQYAHLSAPKEHRSGRATAQEFGRGLFSRHFACARYYLRNRAAGRSGHWHSSVGRPRRQFPLREAAPPWHRGCEPENRPSRFVCSEIRGFISPTSFYAGTACGASCLCLQSAFGHCHTGPAFNHFSTIYGLPHSGHFSGTGLPQATKVHSG